EDAEAHRKLMARLDTMTQEEFLQSLVRSGLCDAAGKLLPPYADEDDGAPTRPTGAPSQPPRYPPRRPRGPHGVGPARAAPLVRLVREAQDPGARRGIEAKPQGVELRE